MANRYWVGDSGNVGDTAHWSLLSGGAGGASVPGLSDDAIFDANSFTIAGQIVTTNVVFSIHSMTWTGALHTPTLNFHRGISVAGNITLISGMILTLTSLSDVLFDFVGVTPQTLTTAGQVLPAVVQITNDTTLQDNFSSTSLLLIQGDFNANGKNVTAGAIKIQGNPAYTVSMGGGTWTIDTRLYNSANSGLDIHAANLTLNANGSPVIFIQGNDDMIIGLGATGAVALAAFTIDYEGSGICFLGNTGDVPTLTSLTVLNGAGHVLSAAAGVTITATSISMDGAAGNLFTLNSDTPGSPGILSVASGTISAAYLDIIDSTATGGATFKAVTSTDGGGNSGWIFYQYVTASVGSNGSVSPSGATLVAVGGSQTYTITANSGFEIADVLIDGTSVGPISSYTFTNVTSGHTIAITFQTTPLGSSVTSACPITEVTLNELVNRMNAYTPIRNMDTVLKVNALDQAIRMFRQHNQPPWTQKRSTMRIFQNVLIYPTPDDFAKLAILDSQLGQNFDFGTQPRYVYASLRDFLEDPTNRNSVAEIWQDGCLALGVRNKTDANLTEQLVDNASTVSSWVGTGDAGTPVLDNVLFITGNSSIRVPVVNSLGVATITDTFQNSFIDANYKQKYFFEWVYLAAIPTNIKMRLRTDSLNYLYQTITSQFGGQGFVANDWNLIAMDLNVASVSGTVSGTFTSAQYILDGAASGNYYFDASYLRGWILEDLWYYSKYNIQNSDNSYAMYFAPDSATYDLAAILLGDTAWSDPLMYEACLYLLSDQKEEKIFEQITDLRNRSWEKFFKNYPDNTPAITTDVYRFTTDYQDMMGWPDSMIR